MRNDVPPMTESEQWDVRVFLAVSHEDGKCHIYGDDGELQCCNVSRHGRTIDFRREPVSDLLAIVKATRWKENGIYTGDVSPAIFAEAAFKKIDIQIQTEQEPRP